MRNGLLLVAVGLLLALISGSSGDLGLFLGLGGYVCMGFGVVEVVRGALVRVHSRQRRRMSGSGHTPT